MDKFDYLFNQIELKPRKPRIGFWKWMMIFIVFFFLLSLIK